MSRAAPLPSPSRRSRSRYGRRPSRSRTIAWPGSDDRWDAISRGARAGWRVAPTRAAAPVMNPSSTTGIRAAAAPSISPTSAAISKPPTAARTPSRIGRIGSVDGERALDDRDLVRAAVVVDARSRSRSRGSTGSPVRTATIALAAVVLPIPISPSPRTSSPPSARRSSDDLEADPDRPGARRSGPSPALGHVAVPARDPRSEEPAARTACRPCARDPRDRRGDADVDDRERRAGGRGEHVDRGATGHEVRDHLRRHVRRVCGHTFRATPWSPAATTIQRRSTGASGRPVMPARWIDELLEPAEAAGRLRQPIEVRRGGRHRGTVSSGPIGLDRRADPAAIVVVACSCRAGRLERQWQTGDHQRAPRRLRPRTAGGRARRGRGRTARPGCIGTMPSPISSLTTTTGARRAPG